MADDTSVLTLTAEIVASYLGTASHVSAGDIPGIIKSVRQALSEGARATSDNPATEAEAPKPDKRAIKKSITDDGLISFIDGKSYKTLKQHVRRHGMDLNHYRERYGLPNDYPSVAPSYSAARSQLAKSVGLGTRGRGAKAQPPAAPEQSSPTKRAPRKAATALAQDAHAEG